MNAHTSVVPGIWRAFRSGLWLATLAVFSLVIQPVQAQDFVWQPADSNDGLWSNPANWNNAAVYFGMASGTLTVTTVPQLGSDLAVIGYSNTPNITLDANYTIGSIGIGGSGDEPSITLDLAGTPTYLTLAGDGLVGNPYSDSPITAGMIQLIGGGALELTNTASLNFVGVDNNATLVFAGTSNAGAGAINNYGTVEFQAYSSGSTATIINYSGGNIQVQDNATLGAGSGTILDNQGSISFYDNSDAGSQVINNEAGQQIDFYDNSSAGSVQITNQAGSTIAFGNNATAASAYLDNEGGAITFSGTATASASSITNNGSMDFYDISTAGSSIISQYEGEGNGITFHNNSTAGSANITTLDGNWVNFVDSSSAGTASLNNYSGASLSFYDSSSAGSAQIDNEQGTLSFNNQSSAGNSVITNNGTIFFYDQASAPNARILNGDENGVIDISNATGNVSIGELSGGGQVYLGSNSLTVGTLGTDALFYGNINDGGIYSSNAGGSLIKDGAGTFELASFSGFTGGVTVSQGILQLDQTGGFNSYTPLTMEGGKFRYFTTADQGGPSGAILGNLTFQNSAGEVETELGPGDSTADAALIFDQLNTRTPGATGNFIINNQSSGGRTVIVLGTGGQTILNGGSINTDAEHAEGFLDPGYFVNGNSYAWYESVSSDISTGAGVRAIDYTNDPSTFTIGATTSIDGDSGYLYVQTTGAVSAQQTAQFETLNLNSADTFTLADGATLYVDGILASANGISAINGGDAIASLSGSEVVVYTSQGSTLDLNTSVTASVLTKSGQGTLNLNNSYTGQLYFDQGSVNTSSTITGTVNANGGSFNLVSGGTVNGDVNVGDGGYVGGSGTVNGKVTVASGGSTFPGDPQIFSASSMEYMAGSAAQFSIATTSSSSHPPTPGMDYDQIQITSGAANALQIDSGMTTLKFNLDPTSLAALQANAVSNPMDNYFLFVLGSATSTGSFTTLTLTDGTNTYTDPFINNVATVDEVGLQFDLSYTANAPLDSILGGNDIDLTLVAVPEPGTWTLLAAGLGLLIVLHKRSRPSAVKLPARHC